MAFSENQRSTNDNFDSKSGNYKSGESGRKNYQLSIKISKLKFTKKKKSYSNRKFIKKTLEVTPYDLNYSSSTSPLQESYN